MNSTPRTDELITRQGQELFYGGTPENSSSIVWDHLQDMQKHAKQLERELNASNQALEMFQESVANSIIANLKSDAAFNKSGL